MLLEGNDLRTSSIVRWRGKDKSIDYNTLQGLESSARTALLEDLVEAGKEERQYGQCVICAAVDGHLHIYI